MTSASEAPKAFLPPMGRDWLLPIYDPLTTLLGLTRIRRELTRQANLHQSRRVLDIGCGTGSLAVLIKRLFPGIDVVGVDPDERALARARRKAQQAGLRIQFDRGFADALAYPSASFDRVFSTFMFHHLQRDDKPRMLREVRRVLDPDGYLHLVDFAAAEPPNHSAQTRGPHAHSRLRDNTERAIITMMKEAGLVDAAKIGERTLLGGLLRVAFYRAR